MADHEGDFPFAVPRDEIKDATHFRSTWLTASQATIRELGHFARYESLLPADRRQEILTIVAGVWLPMETARVHYATCDKLDLAPTDLFEIGKASARRANQTMLALVLRLSRGAGANPWTALAQAQRLWERTCNGGGGMGVFKLGPKEARVEIVGYPLAALRYNRVTFRGILAGIVGLFCNKIYVVELPKMCGPRELGFRLSWA